MIYVMSDIHGCYDEYVKLLENIGFCADDELYILGDVVDRGTEPIKVLQDIMQRDNVHAIFGNHEYMAYTVLKKFCVEVNEENAETHLNLTDMQNYLNWLHDGGKTTLDKFKALCTDERQDILNFFREFSLYEELDVNGNHYILVHAGLNNFAENKSLDDYEIHDFLFMRTDYNRRYFSDMNTFLVTGHTPVRNIRDDKQYLVYEENGHIAIDCGCCFGGKLAAYCLDNGQVYYVPAN